jgi:hypothetical protein
MRVTPGRIPLRLLLAALVVTFVTWGGRPRAQQPTAAFYGIGDLPGGGAGSAVRDATRVDGTIYAVGASTVNSTSNPPFPDLDTPVLWTRTSGGSVALQPLPNIPNPWTNHTSAFAITPDANYIASTVRTSSSAFNTNGVRVDRNGWTNLDLITAPGPNAFAATAISDDGGVVYGLRSNGIGGWRPVRYHVGVGWNLPDLTPTNRTWGTPTPHGTSSDGTVMVGVASINQLNVDPYPAAFRYVHPIGAPAGTTTVIPRLRDEASIEGTWNMPVALSPDGNQTVVIGDSPDYLNGGVYLTNAANEITATLGSPNTFWTPRPLGGLTADGVIAVTFSQGIGTGPTFELAIPFNSRHAYIHNSHGWFLFASVLAAQGIDLAATGWNPGDLAITGVRTIEGVDLVFGQGRRRTVGPNGYVNGALEGFVAELPAGTMAAFNPQPAPPSDLSLVGTWIAGDVLTSEAVISFLADGTYYRISATGFERGLYTWAGNAAGGALTVTTLHDADGGISFSVRNGHSGLSMFVSGDTATFHDLDCPTCVFAANTRVTGSARSIVGGWLSEYAVPDNAMLVVILGASGGNRLFTVYDFPGTRYDSVERGTYTWNAATGELVVTPDGGEPEEPDLVVLSPDERRLEVVSGDLVLTRIIDPRTPLVTSALAATATAGLQFAYQIVATSSPSSFGAVGLPSGLSINAATGVISGAPTATGTFDLLLEASNTLSASTGRNHLSLTVIAPVAITEVGPVVVTPIPADDGEPAPVTIAFSNVTGTGTVSVATIDPETVLAAPDPPAGFSLGDNPVYYEIASTATFDGPVEVCFNYAGVTFSGYPRLLHYDTDLATWVDITTRIDTATTTVCGTTSSFSPFAVAASALAGVGFHAPIDPVAGSLNVVRGGATVSLKFNVYGSNGMEITSPDGIPTPGFTVSSIGCESGAPEEWVDAVTTGGTSLRYDATARQFVQNWKTPKQAGCYIVRVTGDGLLLSARFRVR